jgi:major membrane immunogen (membrane-anchored lipoprotein)
MKKTHLILSLVSLFLLASCGSSKIAKVDPYIGSWSLLIEDTPQGDVSATLTILKSEDGNYSGSISSDMGTFKLSNLSIVEHKISGSFVVQDMDFDLTGTFEDTLFKGYVSGMGADFKSNGKKIIAQ